MKHRVACINSFTASIAFVGVLALTPLGCRPAPAQPLKLDAPAPLRTGKLTVFELQHEVPAKRQTVTLQ